MLWKVVGPSLAMLCRTMFVLRQYASSVCFLWRGLKTKSLRGPYGQSAWSSGAQRAL